MSTNLLNPKQIGRTVKELSDISQNGVKGSSVTAKRLEKAVADIFEHAKKVDQPGANTPAQNLFYMLWKGNQNSLDNLIKSGSLQRMFVIEQRGDARTYKNAITSELQTLKNATSGSTLIKDEQGYGFLAGMVNEIQYSIDDGSVNPDTKASLTELGNALNAHSRSLTYGYSKDPLEKGFEPVAKALYTAANSVSVDMIYSKDRAIASMAFDKFEYQGKYESGQDRTFFGSDVFANIVKDLIENKNNVRVPVDDMKTDIRQTPLFAMSGLSIHDPNQAVRKEDVGLLTSALHKALDNLEDATFKDLNGRELESSADLDTVKNYFKAAVNSLDGLAVSNTRAFKLGAEWLPKDEELAMSMSR